MQPKGLPNYKDPPPSTLEPVTTRPDVPDDHGVAPEPDNESVDSKENDREEGDMIE